VLSSEGQLRLGTQLLLRPGLPSDLNLRRSHRPNERPQRAGARRWSIATGGVKRRACVKERRSASDAGAVGNRPRKPPGPVLRQPVLQDIAMANKEPFASLTGIEQYVQVTERTKHAMENYLSWVQNAMSASPWVNNDLNKKLLSYTTENVTAAVEHVQKLSQAQNLEAVVKIQTEFMSKQLATFNEQTKTIVEICTKAAQGATKSPTT